ncbi:hypothetical protein TIFTF001_003595 [Ficus carica]|uniref:Uncharacterized protein n=1 Tax=Ficus carica TaxID=3494 RepID=A0AA87ZC93_FICCA|nr:hypothetical protein TIFTF001_003595 [Ficus carica]
MFRLHAFDVANELNILPYVFYYCNSLSLSYVFHLPKLDETTTCEYRDLPEPVKLPGLILNTFVDLEPGALKALKEGFYNNPPVYPVGPVVQTGSSGFDEYLGWLDKHLQGSVLFVSFGSSGTLLQEQMTELAFGLEMRFLERARDVGLVVSSWAPLVPVLSHGSTGGFLSTLESIVHGVHLIAWPLYAEQRTKAVSLAEDEKVAIRVKVNYKGLVGREEIVGCVRELMEGVLEGKLIIERMRKLKEKASLALSEPGSSTKSLTNVAQMWVNNNLNS